MSLRTNNGGLENKKPKTKPKQKGVIFLANIIGEVGATQKKSINGKTVWVPYIMIGGYPANLLDEKNSDELVQCQTKEEAVKKATIFKKQYFNT